MLLVCIVQAEDVKILQRILYSNYCIAIMDLQKIGIVLFTMLLGLLVLQWRIVQTKRPTDRR